MDWADLNMDGYHTTTTATTSNNMFQNTSSSDMFNMFNMERGDDAFFQRLANVVVQKLREPPTRNSYEENDDHDAYNGNDNGHDNNNDGDDDDDDIYDDDTYDEDDDFNAIGSDDRRDNVNETYDALVAELRSFREGNFIDIKSDKGRLVLLLILILILILLILILFLLKEFLKD